MKLSDAIKMCLNYKVLGAILAVIVLIYLFAPKFGNIALFLLILVCPLSMVLMMAMMQDGKKDSGDEKTDHTINK